MLTNPGTPFTEEGFAAVVADLRRLFLSVGGSNDLNNASTNVTQDAIAGGENANNAFKFRNVPLATAAPTDGQVIAYSKARTQYEPTSSSAAAFGGLAAANNLTDVGNTATAANNLGVGSASNVTHNTLTTASGATVGATLTVNSGTSTVTLSVTSGATFGGGVRFPLHTMTGNYTALDSDVCIIASGNEVTLPTAAGRGGKMYLISSDPGSGGSTISRSGVGQTVFNLSGVVLGANLTSLLYSDNVSNWYRIQS